MSLLKSSLSQRGQATLEFILVSAVILGMWIGLTAALRKGQVLQTVFGTPWGRLTNTIEFGIPVAKRSQASASHPTSFSRHSTLLNEGN